MFGAYYFDGWSGHHESANDPNQPWAKNATTQMTERLVKEFPEREPVWGWRNDSMEIMERQIDLAADHGIEFFSFCWYWYDNGGPINKQKIAEAPHHTSMELFLKAKNNHRMKFCLLVANHQGSEIIGTEAWKQAADFWIPYLKHPRHLTVDGKPLVIIFNHEGGDKEGFAYLQEAARKAGLPGVAIAGCAGGTLETGYTHRTHYNIISDYTPGSKKLKYSELVTSNEEAWAGSREQPYMPIITAGWDKRPWEKPDEVNSPNGAYYPDRSPEQFEKFLRDAVKWMDDHPDQTTAERIALIYAWNEFGEGGQIAPTKGDPDGEYLKAIKKVVEG